MPSLFKYVYVFSAFLSGLLLFSHRVGATTEIPQLTGRVNDYAAMLSLSTKETLERQLAELESSDSTQLVVLVIDSLHGESIDGYSMKVAEAWKIGQEQADNGVLLLISKNDRKIRIEVGYGLEGKLTDLMSGRIIDSIITPAFKRGDFDQGVIDGVSSIIGVVRGEFVAEKQTAQGKKSGDSDFGGVIGVLFFCFILLKRVATNHKVIASFFGSIIASVAGIVFGFAMLPHIIFIAAFGAFVGFLAGSIPITSAGHSRGSSGHWVGGGSSRSSGGFGGGFSGGGGGGFGGGGASGGW